MSHRHFLFHSNHDPMKFRREKERYKSIVYATFRRADLDKTVNVKERTNR